MAAEIESPPWQVFGSAIVQAFKSARDCPWYRLDLRPTSRYVKVVCPRCSDDFPTTVELQPIDVMDFTASAAARQPRIVFVWVGQCPDCLCCFWASQQVGAD